MSESLDGSGRKASLEYRAVQTKARRDAREAAKEILQSGRFVLDDSTIQRALEVLDSLAEEGSPLPFATTATVLQRPPYLWPFEKVWIAEKLRSWSDKFVRKRKHYKVAPKEVAAQPQHAPAGMLETWEIPC